jgi:hypothetical protein
LSGLGSSEPGPEKGKGLLKEELIVQSQKGAFGVFGIALFMIFTVALALAAGPNTASFSAAANLKPGDIAITGVVNKTFTPIKKEAGKLMNSMVINLFEKTVGGVTITFPADTQPGTYPIEDHLHKPVVDVLAEYSVWGPAHAFYLSTQGTLVLTAVGAKFSGHFEFSAGYNKDETKTIRVVGSFDGVPFNAN